MSVRVFLHRAKQRFGTAAVRRAWRPIKAVLERARRELAPVERGVVRLLAPGAARAFDDAVRRIRSSNLPEILEEHYLADLLAQPALNWIDAFGWRGRPSGDRFDLLYVTSWSSPDMLKDVISYRKIVPGARIALVTKVDTFVARLTEQHLDRRLVYLDTLSLIGCLTKVRADTVIARRGDSQAAVLARLFSKGRLIFKPYDFRVRLPREMVSPLEWEAECFNITHADAVMHLHGAELGDLIAREFGARCPIVSVRPQCLPEFCAPPLMKNSLGDEIHIGYAAGIAAASATERKGDRLGGFNVGLLDKIKRISAQGIHFHVYIAYRLTDDRFQDFIEYERDCAYFHIHDTLPYDELIPRLGSYDFGFVHASYPTFSRIRPEYRGPAGNSVFSYLEAGIPLICSEANSGILKLVTQNGIGVVVAGDAMANLDAVLRNCDYSRLLENVEKAKQDLAYPLEELRAAVGHGGEVAPREYIAARQAS